VGGANFFLGQPIGIETNTFQSGLDETNTF